MGATPPASVGGAPENLLRHYASVLRRRWKWVALGVLVGLAAGYASTVVLRPATVTTHYYKATNTVVVNGSLSSTTGANPLTQMALLVQSKALISTVATDLDLTPGQVHQQLGASVRADNSGIEITAISTDPIQAVALADKAAASLNQAALATAKQQSDSQRHALTQQLDQATSQAAALQAQLDANPTNTALSTELATVAATKAQLTSQLHQLATAPPSFTLSSLAPARPIEINQRGYDYRRTQNVNATSKLNASSGGPNFDETDLSGPALASKKTRLAIGGAAGLVLGLLSAFLFEAWDDRIRSRDRAEVATGLPVLAEIPRLSRRAGAAHEVAMADTPTSSHAERYRAARATLLFALSAVTGTDGRRATTDATTGTTTANHTEARAEASALLVTSPSAGDGKSTTVANLAAACAGTGLRTLVIDGDLHRPTIAHYLRPDRHDDEPELPCATRLDGVWFLAGAAEHARPDPMEHANPDLAITHLQEAMARLRPLFDIILIDTPPLLSTSDVTDLLGATDAVLLVLRVGHTRVGPAERAAETLGRLQAAVIGTMLNGCSDAVMSEYYGYGYGYGRGYSYSRQATPQLDGNAQPVTSPPIHPGASTTARSGPPMATPEHGPAPEHAAAPEHAGAPEPSQNEASQHGDYDLGGDREDSASARALDDRHSTRDGHGRAGADADVSGDDLTDPANLSRSLQAMLRQRP